MTSKTRDRAKHTFVLTSYFICIVQQHLKSLFNRYWLQHSIKVLGVGPVLHFPCEVIQITSKNNLSTKKFKDQLCLF